MGLWGNKEMALDETRMGEMIDLIEEIFEQEDAKADAVGTFNQRIKDAKNTLHQWALLNEIDPDNLNAVYDQYKKARTGKIKWSEEDQEYADLLFEVMERVNKKRLKKGSI